MQPVPLPILRGIAFAVSVAFFEEDDTTAEDVSAETFTAQLRSMGGTKIADFAIDMTDAAGGVVVLSLAESVTSGIDVGVQRAQFDLVRSGDMAWDGTAVVDVEYPATRGD